MAAPPHLSLSDKVGLSHIALFPISFPGGSFVCFQHKSVRPDDIVRDSDPFGILQVQSKCLLSKAVLWWLSSESLKEHIDMYNPFWHSKDGGQTKGYNQLCRHSS